MFRIVLDAAVAWRTRGRVHPVRADRQPCELRRGKIGNAVFGHREIEIGRRIPVDQTGLSAKDFASLADSGRYALPPFLPQNARTAEGFLFPDTYQLLKKGLTPDAVIRRMLDQFQTEAESLDLAGGAERLGLTPYQVVIVASMIEREAQVEEDRPKIASVIYNRLAQGMSLGIDATLLYDDPTPDGQLSTSDLLTNNPYNTRINAGLPPTPIASPGRASLDAALHPADTPYLYYVLCPPDGAGVHRFARTLHEHNVNVQQCLG